MAAVTASSCPPIIRVRAPQSAADARPHTVNYYGPGEISRRSVGDPTHMRADGGTGLKIGWDGIGVGALADKAGVVEVVEALELAGFESAWLGEHPVVVDPQQPPSPLDPTDNLIDPIVALAAAAAVTDRLILGTGVLLLPLHEPLTLAKQLSSLDHLSSGRVIAGVGVGYVRGESDAIGVDFATRGRRADDCIDAMRAMWTQDQPAHDGPFVRFAGVQSYPRPVRSTGVPIHGAGMSAAGRMRAVRRCEGWYGVFMDLEATQKALEELRQLLAQLNRPAALGRLEVTIMPVDPMDADTARRYEDLGVDRLVLNHNAENAFGRASDVRRRPVLEAIERAAEVLAPWLNPTA
jgi:probable F420-dependent oxidoreductase